MTVMFTDDGPRAAGFVTYGESEYADSPYFADQTRRFSAKDWRPMLWTEEEILADPNLDVLELSSE